MHFVAFRRFTDFKQAIDEFTKVVKAENAIVGPAVGAPNNKRMNRSDWELCKSNSTEAHAKFLSTMPTIRRIALQEDLHMDNENPDVAVLRTIQDAAIDCVDSGTLSGARAVLKLILGLAGAYGVNRMVAWN